MKPQARRRSRWMEILLIGTAAVALIGLIGGVVTGARYEPTYRVAATAPTEFGAEGVHCSVTTMYVDDRTGEELLCQENIAPDPSPTRENPFSPDERAEVLALAADLAKDGMIDDAEGRRLSDLAGEIGARHGDVERSHGHWPHTFGVVAVLGLAACLVTGVITILWRVISWLARPGRR
jgi:hypothetical protein